MGNRPLPTLYSLRLHPLVDAPVRYFFPPCALSPPWQEAAAKGDNEFGTQQQQLLLLPD